MVSIPKGMKLVLLLKEIIDEIILDKLLILGAGENSKVVAENYQSCNAFGDIYFLDDNYSKIISHDKKKNFKLIGTLERIFEDQIKKKYPRAIISISDPKIRMYWLRNLEKEKYNIDPIVHKTSYLSKSAKIESGSIIYAKACIQSQVSIGKGTLINTNSCIEHDSKISDGIHICPGTNIGGNVKIGSGSWIGIGSTIIQGITIGENVIIGAGSVVTKDIRSNSKAFGIPAKVIGN